MKLDDKNTAMMAALAQARAAFEADEVPVGAVITHHPSGAIIAAAHNQTEQRQDCTAHAEMLAIAAAQKHLGQKSLGDCDIWVTLEPCAMCATAISHARIARVYYGAADPKSGGIGQGARIFDQPQTHHKPEVYDGIAAEPCEDLLKSFFQSRRV